MDTMATWFGLNERHDDFTIDDEVDAKLFFARHKLQDELHAMLRRAFRTNNPPKMVLYGDWGVGKTHTMRHIEYVIAENSDYRGLVVFVEMPDINAKSTFQVAHAALLDAIGFDRAKRWVLTYQTKERDAFERIREFTQSGDIATAFGNLLALGEGGRAAWDWLRGIPLSSSDSRLVGLPQVLGQSNQLVRALQMLGRLCAAVEEKILVLMLDEATKLGAVSNQDALNHWVNAMKLISDPQTKEFGFIVSGSWADVDDIALPLQDQQVVSRFGEHNYVQLGRLRSEESAEFLRALFHALVDPGKRTALISEHSNDAGGESISVDSFPFTEPGIRLAIDWICRDGGVTTPRDIQKKLDDLLNRAIDDNRHILSEKYINSQLNG